MQVVQQLRAVLVDQCSDSLYLNDDFLEADEIWLVSLRQNPTTIAKSERRLRDCWNPQIFKLDAQAFLINRLQEPAAFLVINLETGADDGVTLFLINYFCHLYSRQFA